MGTHSPDELALVMVAGHRYREKQDCWHIPTWSVFNLGSNQYRTDRRTCRLLRSVLCTSSQKT